MPWSVVVSLAAVAVLLLVSAVSIRREPRRLRNGVLLAGATLGVLTSAAVTIVVLADRAGGQASAWALAGLVVLALCTLLVLGLLNVANGITMLRLEGRGVAHLLSLLFGVGLLGYCVLIVVMWISDLHRASVAFDLFLLLACLGFPLSYLGFVLFAFIGYGGLYGWVVRRWAEPVDVVVVLGAGLRSGRVTPLLAGRLDRGAEVLAESRRRGRDTHVVCSGGQGDDEAVPEAVAMRDHLVSTGVDPGLIWLEDRSTTTAENLAASRDVARAHHVALDHDAPVRFAVVTSDYHTFRAALLMRRLDLGGYATGSRTARYYWPSAILREYVAILREHVALNAVALGLLTLPLIGWLVLALRSLLG